MIERGDIFYVRIEPGSTTGHEIQKDRPCVVVSKPELCREAKVVSVVMLTTSRLQHIKDMPEHVSIRSTGKILSTAMCESVYTVDVSRLKSKMGRVTKSEQQMIDMGLMIGLGLDFAPTTSLQAAVSAQSFAGGKLEAENVRSRARRIQEPGGACHRCKGERSKEAMNEMERACEYLEAMAKKAGVEVLVMQSPIEPGKFQIRRKGGYRPDRIVTVSMEEPRERFAAKVRGLMEG